MAELSVSEEELRKLKEESNVESLRQELEKERSRCLELEQKMDLLRSRCGAHGWSAFVSGFFLGGGGGLH